MHILILQAQVGAQDSTFLTVLGGAYEPHWSGLMSSLAVGEWVWSGHSAKYWKVVLAVLSPTNVLLTVGPLQKYS